MYNVQVLGVEYYDYLTPLVLAGIMYLTMTLVISWLARKLERRLAVSD